MKQFWMLYREGGGAPTHVHDTLDSARFEAERLARTVGGRIAVLEAIGVVEKRDLTWTDVGHHRAISDAIDADIPF